MGDDHGHPPDLRKAYGLVTAVGTKLGEKARTEPGLLPALRATPDAEAFRALVRQEAGPLLPAAVLDNFLGTVVTDKEWLIWRSRLLLQLKMVRDGAKPAAGHEDGRGVGRP